MDRIHKIITWNANGLAKHLQGIKIFIFSKNIDILLALLKYTLLTRTTLVFLSTYIVSQMTDGKVHGGTARKK
jgi:hypothetical protein